MSSDPRDVREHARYYNKEDVLHSFLHKEGCHPGVTTVTRLWSTSNGPWVRGMPAVITDWLEEYICISTGHGMQSGCILLNWHLQLYEKIKPAQQRRCRTTLNSCLLKRYGNDLLEQGSSLN